MPDEKINEIEKNYSILTDEKLGQCIYDIIEQTEKYCFIVSPFLDILYWGHLTQRLDESARAKKRILFISKRPYLDPKSSNYQIESKKIEQLQQKLTQEYKFDLYFVEKLHAKIYLNENEVLITSMNLQDSAYKTNYEIGTLIKDAAVSLDIVHNYIFKRILSGNPEYVEGRWAEWVKDKQRFLDGTSGYCINCHSPIPYNENNPLCGKCNNEKVGDNNFCHKCGTTYQSISVNFPLCRSCYDIVHEKRASSV